ncbi:T9SS type A sorting domain-containing protein [Hymenobacter busanensis]|uniref:T9SS type A sorting domain-containing protein n=1 Tax=Hymenobacter busanensis TaxID=2607656 RepID=A0A7L4ZS51_9BACT|nr:matrixin family metalloprotease [Hymenobacter busanensis]KAA9327553.1 T9SS type A sorting domain-containing protein [Hymenobacter busanensis]QHJ06109.1 T9SS type A sorting domain-containing protein [Hymenobacter busanensis]
MKLLLRIRLLPEWECLALFAGLLLTNSSAALAQSGCLLRPVTLAERVAGAPLVVEAGIGAQQPVASGQHLFTVSQLTVFQVLQGQLPAGRLQLAEPGGSLEGRREVVSTAANLQPGQQGVFFLEPDPANPASGFFRLYAGPQGIIRYDLTTRTAADPFTRYASIETEVYPALLALTRQPMRRMLANAALAEPLPQHRPAAVPVVSGFAPTTITAGTGAVLTINGTNFGATRGNGQVLFPDANQGGPPFMYAPANPTDYVLWSDNQIQVRVPSLIIATNGTAGSGVFRVTNNDGETGTSPASLTVVYALTNALASGSTTPTRPRLINDDGQGGYTLQYSPSFTNQAGATASFERALNTWTCATQLRRAVSSTPAPEATANDGVNAVRFGSAVEVPTGVLGFASSYYSGCTLNGVTAFSLVEMDYTFNSGTNWQFGPAQATGSQYDFESVALHELGHGTQLSHIIDPTAVMHFAIANATNKRRLRADSDVAAGLDVFNYSATNPCTPFFPALSPPVAAAVPAVCPRVLPVELVSFTATHNPSHGTRLVWTTASEKNSAYFGVETTALLASDDWAEVQRVPAAGSSNTPRRYEALHAAPLSGIRYYRLRQVDEDGSTQFSPVVSVRGDVTSQLQVYPNPATDRLQVLGPATEGTVQLTFYDLAGRRQLQWLLPASQTEVSVASLRPGWYWVEWSNGNTVLRARLAKN